MNKFFDVNGANGKCTEKKLVDLLILNVNGVQCFWSFSLTHSCIFKCQRRHQQDRKKNGEMNIFFMSTVSTVKYKKNCVIPQFFLCQRCQWHHQTSNQQYFWSFSLTHSCFSKCQWRQRPVREKKWGDEYSFFLSTASAVKCKKNWVIPQLFFCQRCQRHH